jgi:hypothetical protein
MNNHSSMTEEENPLFEQRLNNALDGLEDYFNDHLKNRVSAICSSHIHQSIINQ